MSAVDEWADRYFCREFPLELDTPTHKAFFATGADTLAALLLSDEAALEACDLLREQGHDIGGATWRAALTAALTKITEGKE